MPLSRGLAATRTSRLSAHRRFSASTKACPSARAPSDDGAIGNPVGRGTVTVGRRDETAEPIAWGDRYTEVKTAHQEAQHLLIVLLVILV